MASRDHIRNEPKVRFFDPMPKGYVFVPKGNVFVTKICRKKTHELRQTLYEVIDKHKKTLGLRCPAHVLAVVEAEDVASAERRAEAVRKRDGVVQGKFADEILRLYPKTPTEEIPKIVKHSLTKRSGRVGTTSRLDLDEKVRLAVRAHIRHSHTNYDELLKETKDREASRRQIWPKLHEIAKSWGEQKTRKPNKREPKSPHVSTPKRIKTDPLAKRATILPGTRQLTLSYRTRGSTRENAIDLDEEPELVDDEYDAFTKAGDVDGYSDDCSSWSVDSSGSDSDLDDF
ncbi:hypothetical protein B0H66DRAFT_606978 [Apodospora peruviana]|uniref:DUF2293 domain-containing protein n=1 Tax=Apodospora peruviana TaxID=516989 RepID=A0AAE0HVL9_9PEZI|nr:hypothetical protein B0H66DRAFT_606978 [Apodospora peruviana]